MIEIPEAVTLAQQITETLHRKKIKNVVAGSSPHKFAWFFGDPAEYNNRLQGKTVRSAVARGGLVEVTVDDLFLLFGDMVVLTLFGKGEKRPVKHQLLIEFEDETALVSAVRMYGGMWCFHEGEFDSPYYEVACEKPSPLSVEFDEDYFFGMADFPDHQKMSAKAFLATEQRIPGLGNGVLQDILYNAGIHPKRKISTCTEDEIKVLFDSVKTTIKEMTDNGGRDTERNLFDEPGGYATKLSKNTVGQACPKCGGKIVKLAFMGGVVYYCEGCQEI